MRIAILEDDPAHLEMALRLLKREGHDAVGFPTCAALMREAASGYDLYLLDWNVSDGPGIEVLEWIRRTVPGRPPVLFVTVRDDEHDIVSALEKGADDYMVKPVRAAELVARVNALLRRAYPAPEKKLLIHPPYNIDVTRSEIRFHGAAVALTPKEYDLALVLFRNMGTLLSRAQLTELVWGSSAPVDTRTIDTHVSQLRKKLDLRAENGFRIAAVHSYGYRFDRLS